MRRAHHRPGRRLRHAALRRALARLTLALLVLVSAQLPAVASAAPAGVPGEAALPHPVRLGGVDRYDQSVRASQAAAHASADTVYIASGERFPDALSAASVAAIARAPLLLTPKDSLPDVVRAEVARLSPATVVVVGGEQAISEMVASQLSRAASGITVVRVGGADRYAVSRALVLDPTVGVPSATQIIVATGAGFPDALSSVPPSAHLTAPVVLVDGAEAAPTPAERSLLRELRLTGAFIVGGTSAIDPRLEREISATVPTWRVAGADRFATSVAFNDGVFPTAKTAYLASGLAFPDALSGGPLAASDDSPLYLVRPDCVPSVVIDHLRHLAPTRIVLLGGTAALTPAVEALTPCV